MHAVIALLEGFMREEERKEEKASMLAIAYHNVAVELEHLHRLGESLEYYNKAVTFAKDHLPSGHNIV